MSAQHVHVNDAGLVLRACRGDRAAYGELVRRHQDAIYRYLSSMGLDHDTALDLVQDALVRAYARLDDCHSPDHFRAWLYRIARNLCLDHLKNVRRLGVPLSAAGSLEASADRTADRTLVLTMRAALDRLSVPMREAFMLKHDAGYTYDEIAEMTGTTPSAVKMRVHRAREQLREFLDEQDINAA